MEFGFSPAQHLLNVTGSLCSAGVDARSIKKKQKNNITTATVETLDVFII